MCRIPAVQIQMPPPGLPRPLSPPQSQPIPEPSRTLHQGQCGFLVTGDASTSFFLSCQAPSYQPKCCYIPETLTSITAFYGASAYNASCLPYGSPGCGSSFMTGCCPTGVPVPPSPPPPTTPTPLPPPPPSPTSTPAPVAVPPPPSPSGMNLNR